ncbi:MAG: M15 family metallopeptidase [Flavobacterium sp.]
MNLLRIKTLIISLLGNYLFAQEKVHVASETLTQIHDTTFVDIASLDVSFSFDLKYATADNFLQAVIYDCPKCYLRYKVAKALMAAQAEFMQLGYRIRLLDCYRPLSAQKLMFEKVPNPRYVASPVTGSVHNRGAAVDITLETLEGELLDMGTDFDHFGPQSAWEYQGFSENIKNNRNLLRNLMGKHGFDTIQSEWWHFNFRQTQKDPISDFKWSCD